MAKSVKRGGKTKTVAREKTTRKGKPADATVERSGNTLTTPDAAKGPTPVVDAPSVVPSSEGGQGSDPVQAAVNAAVAEKNEEIRKLREENAKLRDVQPNVRVAGLETQNNELRKALANATPMAHRTGVYPPKMEDMPGIDDIPSVTAPN